MSTVPSWDTADHLRKALRHAGMAVGEMADYLGVERNTVGRYINGRTRPDVRTLRLWAMRCGVDYSWLTSGVAPSSAGGDADRSVTRHERTSAGSDLAPVLVLHPGGPHRGQTHASCAEDLAA